MEDSSTGVTANLLQPSAFVVVQELAERPFVHLVQHVAELLVVAAALGEGRPIVSSERADQRIALRPIVDTTISAAANFAFVIDLVRSKNRSALESLGYHCQDGISMTP
jgi:hypothetical protein